MNTRQKLTLGIAAIFMVTLTIVGVTYAYFVTRVTGDNGEEAVNVQTAQVASIEYGDGNEVIEMKNVLPGETVYKTFTVTNTDAQITGIYDVYLSAVLPTGETIEFVHTDTTASCYTETAYDTLHGEDGADKTALKTACYKSDKAYNNIQYTLYRVNTLPTGTIDGVEDNNIVTENGNKITRNGNVPYGTNASNPITLLPSVNILPGNTVHNYVLKVDYVNVEGNQNIEQDAALDILVDIVKR